MFSPTATKHLLKGIVHPKMKLLSSFTHPQVDPNLYECVSSEHKGRYFEYIYIFDLYLSVFLRSTVSV